MGRRGSGAAIGLKEGHPALTGSQEKEGSRNFASCEATPPETNNRATFQTGLAWAHPHFLSHPLSLWTLTFCVAAPIYFFPLLFSPPSCIPTPRPLYLLLCEVHFLFSPASSSGSSRTPPPCLSVAPQRRCDTYFRLAFFLHAYLYEVSIELWFCLFV